MTFSRSIKDFQSNLHEKVEQLVEGLPKVRTPETSSLAGEKESNARFENKEERQ